MFIDMFQAVVIQWVRPNAQQRDVCIELPLNLQSKYDEIIASGCDLTIENCGAFWHMSIHNGEMDVVGELDGDPRSVMVWRSIMDKFTPEMAEMEPE